MADAKPAGPAPGDDGDMTFTDAPDDLRDLVVVDPDAHRVGEVDGVVVDPTDRRMRMLVVGSGGILGLGRVRRLVPVEAIVEVSDHVRIATSHRAVHLVDPYDPEESADHAQ